MHKIEFQRSWADTLADQQTVEGKVVVHLMRALRQGSKALIASEIDTALRLLQREDLTVYMMHHQIPWTQQGLYQAARQLAAELGHEV